MTKIDDFRPFMMRELLRRQSRNSAYTLSAFARDLKMSPQKLGQVLKGRTGLSQTAAKEISECLDLSENEKCLFLALIESKHARSRLLRAEASARVEQLQKESAFVELDPDSQVSLLRWESWAAFLLVDVKDFRPDTEWIAQRLGISVEMCARVYDELFQKGFLTVRPDGRWVQTDRKISFAAPRSSSEIRDFYRQILKKAEASLDGEPVDQRYFHVSMIPVRHSDMAEFQERIDTFVHSLLNEFENRSQGSDRVCSVAVELFPLDRMENKR